MPEKANEMPNILNRLITGHFIKNLSVNLLFIYSLLMFPASGQNDTTDTEQQKPNAPERNISLFDTDELLEITLYLDLTRFSRKPRKDDSFDAEMTIHFSETDSLNKKTTIKYRGVSRFQICSFPPMELNFKKPLNYGSGKIKKLKLVTHCESGKLSDEYILREYLVYKLFNVLTDTSFRVRLLKVNYIDTKGNKKPVRKYGIFIEPIDLLAERTNSTIVKTPNLGQSHILQDVMDRLAIFNYMISNWDWSVTGQHNVAVIKSMKYENAELGIAIPYDFDLTGVVNAEYAVPPPALNIENIRERLFSGICRSKEVFQEDLKKFSYNKEKLYSVINGFPHLSQRSKKDITTFLDQFFDQLEKQKSLDTLVDLFVNSCKK